MQLQDKKGPPQSITYFRQENKKGNDNKRTGEHTEKKLQSAFK